MQKISFEKQNNHFEMREIRADFKIYLRANFIYLVVIILFLTHLFDIKE